MPKEYGYIKIIRHQAVGMRPENVGHVTAVIPPSEPEFVLITLGTAGWMLSPDAQLNVVDGELRIEREAEVALSFVPEGPFTEADFDVEFRPLNAGDDRDRLQHEYERNGWDLIAEVRLDNGQRTLQFRRPQKLSPLANPSS